ncbi:MAG TPA: hypothetical protein VFS92_04590 [Planctomycetota bacterium]|nr:hypothetical protein [Planctomycetota bacterium]
MQPEFVLQFGSRSGSLAALGFFAALFGLLGWGIVRECRRRGVAPGAARTAAAALFAVLIAAVYLSSLGGFYELRSHGSSLETRSLISVFPDRLSFGDLARVEGEPAFRGRWRLVLVDAAGGRRESATADRETVEAAVALLRPRLLQAR